MISRGSSVHHTRRTNNPFMTTSSGIVGIDLHEKVTFDAPKRRSNNQIGTGQPRSSNSLTEFMYQTTSGALGEKVEASGLVTIRHVDVAAPEDCAIRPEEIMPRPIDIKPITEAQGQHPLYATSCRDIGAEKAQLKVEVERLGRPNTFTNSFNGFRYRDFGLNTAVTKSRICDQLEYS
ncbi:hypothetical protein GQ600_23047 [Phytophthora cactorum]|nr:hypothetical protein GQ600_23047 [Phytophthora cactorum]